MAKTMKTIATDTATADANPTKELFIDTLVRDIDLAASIVDLLDNCVDGAKRIRPAENFQGLKVELTVNADTFRLHDNCGGISIEIAENYAFRFGRSHDGDGVAVKHSVGRFGVGMKRTLFKVAKKVEIASVASKSRFTLSLDIDAWKRTKKWSFPLKNVRRREKQPVGDIGTKVDVTELRHEVRKMFGDDVFVNELRDDIRDAHRRAMDQGLTIVFNGIELTANPLCLLSSREIRPYRDVGEFHVAGGVVKYRILAGIDEKDSKSAGWYVYCNGRLLLSADQSETTGWGSMDVQKFHQQFNRFRGYAYLDAEDGALLPWNTTKTGVSEDAEIYEALLGKLRNALREVNTFLNYRRREEKSESGDEPILKAIKAAKRSQVRTGDEFPTCIASFVWPRNVVSTRPGPDLARISYKVPRKDLDALKDALDVTTAGEVGLKTFEYYIQAELE